MKSLLLALATLLLATTATADPVLTHGTCLLGESGGDLGLLPSGSEFFTCVRFKDSLRPPSSCQYGWQVQYDAEILELVSWGRATTGVGFGTGSAWTVFSLSQQPSYGCPTCMDAIGIFIYDVDDKDPYQPLADTQFGDLLSEVRLEWRVRDFGDTTVVPRFSAVGGVGGVSLWYVGAQCNFVAVDETELGIVTFVPEPGSGALLAGVLLLGWWADRRERDG